MHGQVHRIFNRLGSSWMAGLVLAFLIFISISSAAIDESRAEFYLKIKAKDYRDRSYTIKDACEVVVDFEKGVIVKENWRSFMKSLPRNKFAKVPMPWYLLWQVLEENKGESSWEEPKPSERSTDELKKTEWGRKDGHIVVSTTEEDGNLIDIEVTVNSEAEEFPPLVLADPATVTMTDIEWFVRLIKPHQASLATKVLSVEVRKDFIIEAELEYIRASRKRWSRASTEANRLLQMENLPSYIKEWLGWVIKGAEATQKAELAGFHIAAATLDEGLLSMRRMAQP